MMKFTRFFQKKCHSTKKLGCFNMISFKKIIQCIKEIKTRMFQLSHGWNRTSLYQIAKKCHQFKDRLLLFGFWTIPELFILAYCLHNFEVCLGWNDSYLEHSDTNYSQHAWSEHQHAWGQLQNAGVGPIKPGEGLKMAEESLLMPGVGPRITGVGLWILKDGFWMPKVDFRMPG